MDAKQHTAAELMRLRAMYLFNFRARAGRGTHSIESLFDRESTTAAIEPRASGRLVVVLSWMTMEQVMHALSKHLMIRQSFTEPAQALPRLHNEERVDIFPSENDEIHPYFHGPHYLWVDDNTPEQANMTLLQGALYLLDVYASTGRLPKLECRGSRSRDGLHHPLLLPVDERWCRLELTKTPIYSHAELQ